MGILLHHCQIVFYVLACFSVFKRLVIRLDKVGICPSLLLDKERFLYGRLDCLVRADLASYVVHLDLDFESLHVIFDGELLSVELIVGGSFGAELNVILARVEFLSVIWLPSRRNVVIFLIWRFIVVILIEPVSDFF